MSDSFKAQDDMFGGSDNSLYECGGYDQKDAGIKTLNDSNKILSDRHIEDLKIIKELEEVGVKWMDKSVALDKQLDEANEILIGFSGKDGYEKVNQYFAKYKGE